MGIEIRSDEGDAIEVTTIGDDVELRVGIYERPGQSTPHRIANVRLRPSQALRLLGALSKELDLTDEAE